jgi:hypothetical protein
MFARTETVTDFTGLHTPHMPERVTKFSSTKRE